MIDLELTTAEKAMLVQAALTADRKPAAIRILPVGIHGIHGFHIYLSCRHILHVLPSLVAPPIGDGEGWSLGDTGHCWGCHSFAGGTQWKDKIDPPQWRAA